MKRLATSTQRLLVAVSLTALIALAGCFYEEPAYPPPPPAYGAADYDYYYYPDCEVYYYPVTGVYFWFGGGGWHSGRHLPRTIVLRPESRVSVRLNTRTPYQRHEEIRARYPAHAPGGERHEEPMEHGGGRHDHD